MRCKPLGPSTSAGRWSSAPPQIPMSFLAAAYLLERYGLRLALAQLGEVLDMSAGSIRNQISEERFPVPTYLDQGRRYADHRDVAEYLDAARARAKTGSPA